MTEADFYLALALPVVMTVSLLTFSKAPWPLRLRGAVACLAAGATVGFGWIWALKAGAPGWTIWAFDGVLLAVIAAWAWTRRRSAAT